MNDTLLSISKLISLQCRTFLLNFAFPCLKLVLEDLYPKLNVQIRFASQV